MAGFFDFIEFIIMVFYVPNIIDISPSIVTRLGCLSTITSALICVFALGFKVGLHHKCSLISLSICFIITLTLEFIMKPDDKPWSLFIFTHFLVCIYLISISFNDCTERYLAYYNFLNPFLILTGEGTFEFILAIFFSINKDPFRGIINEYEENTAGKFGLLIFLLFIYFILSVIINAYKVYSNVIYTPIARSLTEYFLNPLTNIYYLLAANDFHKNYIYFACCEIICMIMDFSFYVYNEYVTLYFCGLQHDTRNAIIKRSIEGEDNISEENFKEDEEENNNPRETNFLSEMALL